MILPLVRAIDLLGPCLVEFCSGICGVLFFTFHKSYHKSSIEHSLKLVNDANYCQNLFVIFIDFCFLSRDGVHLSAEGSKVVVEEILKVLKEAEWEPCFHWKSMPTEYGENSPYDLVASDGKTTINPSEWTFHREIQWD